MLKRKLHIVILLGALAIFSGSCSLFQGGMKKVKTEDQKEQFLELQEEREEKKQEAQEKGKKKHMEIQDKETRKRMKRNRRKMRRRKAGKHELNFFQRLFRKKPR
jgi:hypothetical protein